MTADRPVPTVLAANQPRQFYRGGSSIARLRGDDLSAQEGGREFGPEDWVASITTQFGREKSGLSLLPNGIVLRDAVSADPIGWLGPEHHERFGDSTALLVKLLDAGQRLPVHCHPSDSFAQQHFHSHFGKTEAWIVIGASGEDPCVYAGFTEDVDDATVREWVDAQDRAAMLGALNKIGVSPGDALFIPAGLPHSIGEGVFIVELQQPTDLSVTLEWQGFLDSAEIGSLGIGFDTAVGCLDRSAWDEDRLSTIMRRTGEMDSPCIWLLAPENETFFRAHRLATRRGVLLDQGFSVLVVLEGGLTLRPEFGENVQLYKGNTVVIPHAAGKVELLGDATSIHCRPPRTGGDHD